MRASTRDFAFIGLAAFCGLSCATVGANVLYQGEHRPSRRQFRLGSSKDGNCGIVHGSDTPTTCLGSDFGDCCSRLGFCGNTTSYCGGGCQPDYGTCGDSSISTDGSCGGSKGLTCLGSEEGDCCSEKGFCGETSVYCGAGCQSAFGYCDGDNSTNSDSPASDSNSGPAGSDGLATSSTPELADNNGEEDSGGISMGAKIGLGAGIPVGVLLAGGLATWVISRRRKRDAGAAVKDTEDEKKISPPVSPPIYEVEDAGPTPELAAQAKPGNIGGGNAVVYEMPAEPYRR
ncbi:uncharacterized protein DNG_09697 [Cephalotrichum gorgonifer]|uniref:Chitin-binding type-1 domain-containing protein n=1 Tax=Cephalotrichum gorgonifer TaxID=2041049 RepID=A0AAE8SZN8_9PEZI|nr:uncharacterized protein DNG_09697 [Cephalotrichum gorgonifer]